MKPFSYIHETKIIQRFTMVDDGYYSHVMKSETGEFDSFAKAKKQLVKDTNQRMRDFKQGWDNIKKTNVNNIEGDGDFFDIDYDGMYTNISRTPYETEFKDLKSVKKLAVEYLQQQFSDWQSAWKRAVSLKVEDVE